MPDTILLVVEQREGKLNRVSWETVAAGQAIAAATGWNLEAAVCGDSVAALAAEVAAKKVAKVYAMGRTVISDCIGFKYEGGKLVFTRQMFQGKLAADVSFTSDAPWFATFQNGAFRGDKAETGPSAAPVETFSVEIADGVVRNKPQEVFKEAKQAVDLTQAEIIVAVGRGIKEQKNIEIAKQLADALGGDLAASRPICDSGWLPMDRQIGSSGQTVAPKLYLALGISGAIQHIVGMKGARTIIAVNKDSEAPIFEIADYAIVGNLFDIVPPLIEEVKKAKG